MKNAIAVLLALLAAACGGEPQEAAHDGMPMSAETMDDMAMPSLDLLPTARAHVESLRTAPPQELPGLLAGHRARVDTLLAAMAADMAGMGMAGDAAWQALEDSVRADLRSLESLEGEAFVLRTRGHAGRLGRLLSQHEMMMRM